MKNRNIKILSLISFLQGLVFYCSIPALYRQQYGLNLSDILFIESISWIFTLLFELPWGYFSDRYGYKKTLIISNLIFFISKIAFYIAKSFPLFLIERIFLAISISGISGCDTALLYESSSSNNKVKHYGYVNAFGTVGVIIASLFSPLIIAISMRLTALLTIFPYAIASILSFLLLEVSPPKGSKEIGIIKSLNSIDLTPQMIFFAILGATITEFSYSAGVMLNQSQYAKVGILIQYYGQIYAVLQIIPIAAVTSYKIIQKAGCKTILVFLICMIIFAGITLSFCNSIVPSLLSIAFIILASAIFQPLAFSIKNERLQDTNRATILSLYASIEEITAAVINLLTGKAADISVGKAFLFQTSLFGIIALIYGAISIRDKLRP